MNVPKMPTLGEGSQSPYFPPLYGMPECMKCERKRTCFSCGKAQRNLREFTYTSGRCPRLPDKRGFVEKDEQKRYQSVFPLVYVDCISGGDLNLTMFFPGSNRSRKVYYSDVFKRWWIRVTEDGEPVKRFLRIENFMKTRQDIVNYMECRQSKRCVFRCDIDYEAGFF